ncbi:MAG TPA: histidine--tRNA ligase [Candidatus Dormibacteraeota bacterium]|jgi:histidyl-tRNA synthetase|nr:histidine--tRNA ligase [Candidatus Dormibacteraeota bacterium]
MPPIRSVAGMNDLLPQRTATWSRLEAKAAELAELRGYWPVVTPVVEPTELFTRAVGAGTDVVEKEMYTFEDRGGRSLTLRPEATASVVRAYFEGGLHDGPQPVRLRYLGPMFRHDRPQAGRYRQFFQFGVEAIGEAAPGLDVEVIELAYAWLAAIGVPGVSLQVNSIGDEVCRPAYREALRDHFRPHLAEMCEDCRRRFEVNPLRLLDCKKPSCVPFQAGAPSPVDHLCEPCRAHHQAVLAGLRALAIPFEQNPRLVRGLDYYTRTAFELWSTDLDGAQNALGGGGRYDGLAKELGFADTPGIGFAMGMERAHLALQRAGQEDVAPVPDVFVIPAAPGSDEAAQRVAADLRGAALRTVVSFGERSLKASMRAAQKSGAACVVILGEQELAAGEAAVRNMATGEQERVALGALAPVVADRVDAALAAAAAGEGGLERESPAGARASAAMPDAPAAANAAGQPSVGGGAKRMGSAAR